MRPCRILESNLPQEGSLAPDSGLARHLLQSVSLCTLPLCVTSICAFLTKHYLPWHLQGFNPVYPPLNPVYPPPGPAMVPPAQPPQWNGPPAGPYPPGPEAPMVCFWFFCLSWYRNSKEGWSGLGQYSILSSIAMFAVIRTIFHNINYETVVMAPSDFFFLFKLQFLSFIFKCNYI